MDDHGLSFADSCVVPFFLATDQPVTHNLFQVLYPRYESCDLHSVVAGAPDSSPYARAVSSSRPAILIAPRASLQSGHTILRRLAQPSHFGSRRPMPALRTEWIGLAIHWQVLSASYVNRRQALAAPAPGLFLSNSCSDANVNGKAIHRDHKCCSL